MAGEDRAYADWIRNQPCAVCSQHPSNIHHKTGAGMGLRSHDHEGMPLCGSGVSGCHGSLHNPVILGYFRDWGRAEKRDWQEEMVKKYRKMYGEEVSTDLF